MEPWPAKICLLVTGGAAVIKAQVLAGGRGKGHFDSGLQGGVKLADRYMEVNKIPMKCGCVKNI